MATIEKQKKNTKTVGKNVEKLEHLCTVTKNTAALGNSMVVPQKVNKNRTTI